MANNYTPYDPKNDFESKLKELGLSYDSGKLTLNNVNNEEIEAPMSKGPEFNETFPEPKPIEEVSSEYELPKDESSVVAPKQEEDQKLIEEKNKMAELANIDGIIDQNKPKREKIYADLKQKYSLDRPGMSDEDLQSAMGKRDVATLAANIGEGLSDIAMGGVGGKTDKTYYDRLRQSSAQPVEDIALMKQAVAQKLGVDEKLMELTERTIKQMDEDALKDPNHPMNRQMSILLESQLAKNNPELLKQLKDEGHWPPTGQAIKQFFDQIDKESDRQFKEKQLEETTALKLASLQNKQAEKNQFLEQRQTEEERRLNKQINDEAQRLGRGDAVIKKIREQSSAFEEIGPLLEASEKGNQAGVAALGTRLARAMGEVGVLTDTDVTRYLGNTSWARKFSSWLSKGATGELPDAQIDDLRSMTNMLNTVYNDKISRRFNEAAAILQKRYPNLSEEEAKEKVGHPEYILEPELKQLKQKELKSTISSDKVKVKNPSGQIGMIPRSQLEKAKSQGYQEVE